MALLIGIFSLSLSLILIFAMFVQAMRVRPYKRLFVVGVLCAALGIVTLIASSPSTPELTAEQWKLRRDSIGIAADELSKTNNAYELYALAEKYSEQKRFSYPDCAGDGCFEFQHLLKATMAATKSGIVSPEGVADIHEWRVALNQAFTKGDSKYLRAPASK